MSCVLFYVLNEFDYKTYVLILSVFITSLIFIRAETSSSETV